MSEPKILKKQTLHFVQALAKVDPDHVSGHDGDGDERNIENAIQMLDLNAIDLANTQFEYRLDPGIELLMESIRRDGQQIPVILRGKKPPYQLICGFRRVRSIKALGVETVKAIVLEEIADDKAHRLSVLENEERKSLTDLDRANACQRFHEEGNTQEEIAEIMNCSRVKVSRYMSLLKVTPAIFEALKTNRIPTMHAILLQQASARFSEKQIGDFITAIANKELSTRELERRIKRVDNKDVPVRQPELFKQTTMGFKLSGISYRGNMDRERKKQVVAALKKALALLTGKEGSDE